MCGVAGAWWRSPPADAESRLESAVNALAHRGPDARGSRWFGTPRGRVGLGHTRLAILDLSERGNQPMSSADGHHWLVYNGEIYNYLELKKELQREGVSFHTSTDTEVLLAALTVWGLDCLPRLTGMFAFCLYDSREQTLTLARDAFGMKPLYVQHGEDHFLTASELPAVLALRRSPPRLHWQRSYDYLAHGDYDTTDSSFVEGIRHVPQGTSLTLHMMSGAVPEPRRWWTPRVHAVADMSFPQAVEAVRARFMENIEQHLRSDVPVGAALSGGIDSSSVVCAMRHLHPELPIHTFSYEADDPSISESRWVGLVNESVGAQNHTVRASPQGLAEDLDDLIACQGEPFGGSSLYAQYLVFRTVREHGIPVTLDGQGADELLAGYHGYPNHRILSLLEQGRWGAALAFAWRWGGWPNRSFKWAVRDFVRFRGDLLRKASVGAAAFPDWTDAGVLADADILPGLAPHGHGSAGRGRRVVEELARVVARGDLAKLLRHGDRNAMRFSVESRLPFLTTGMADLLFQLPEAYLIGPTGETKRVFRAAMRGIVPDAVLDRRDKIGFATPEAAWLRRAPETVVESLRMAQDVPFLRTEEMERHFRHFVSGKGRFSPTLWRWLNFGRWYRMTFEA